MKWLIIALSFGLASADAQSLSERSGLNALLDRPPTATDLVLELYLFDLFEENVADSAAKRGDDALRKYAAARSRLARTKDDELVSLQKKAGLRVRFPEKQTQTRLNESGRPGDSVDETYIREFYRAQVAENKTAISVLARYLAKPDNDEVKVFAAGQLPAFKKNLDTAQQILDRLN